MSGARLHVKKTSRTLRISHEIMVTESPHPKSSFMQRNVTTAFGFFSTAHTLTEIFAVAAARNDANTKGLPTKNRS